MKPDGGTSAEKILSSAPFKDGSPGKFRTYYDFPDIDIDR